MARRKKKAEEQMEMFEEGGLASQKDKADSAFSEMDDMLKKGISEEVKKQDGTVVSKTYKDPAYAAEDVLRMLRAGEITREQAEKFLSAQKEAGNYAEGGYEDGGLKDEGGSVDPVSGNDVPSGSTQEEVRDDIPAKLSEGEFVLPADVVRYIGLENIMKMRDMAKEGLAKMEDMGQMGNSEEAVISDTADFDAEIDQFIEELDRDDEPEGFAVGGLAGQPTTPQEQAAQIYQQTSGVGFLPPGVTAPGVDANLPEAPVITPGGTGAGGVPTYETKQYIGPNGEIRTFTFINGQAFPPIPEGFKEYDPTKVPEEKTGVPTAKVTQQDGGDGPDDTKVETTKVDPVSGIAKSFAEENPNSKVAKTVKSLEELNEKFNKSLVLSLGSFLMGGGIAGIAGVAYGAYKYNKQATELNNQLNAQLMEALGPAAENIIKDAGQLDPTRFTEQAVQESYTQAVKAGASPALASAIATTTSRAFSEIPEGTDLGAWEQSTADIFRDETGGVIMGLDPASAQQAMLTEQDFGLFDTPEERAAFYADRGPAPSNTGFQRTVNGIPVDDFSTYRDANKITARTGLTTAPTTYNPRVSSPEAARLGYSAREVDQLASDLNVTREQAASMLADRTQQDRSSLTEQALDAARAPSRTVTSQSGYGTRSVSPGDTVSFQSDSGKTTNVTGKSYTDAFGNTRQGGFVDSNNDGVQQKDERSTVTSGSGGTVTSKDGTPVTSRSQAQIEADTGGPAGDGTYCCTKMVEHGLWSNKKELAKMHNWHMKQPQWWRDGYDVWGKLLANTLLKTKSKFWTSVMQECYEYHVHNKKLNFKSALGNGIMYSGVFVFGQIANLTGRHLNEV